MVGQAEFEVLVDVDDFRSGVGVVVGDAQGRCYNNISRCFRDYDCRVGASPYGNWYHLGVAVHECGAWC